MPTISDAMLRENTAELLSKIDRRLSKLGDPVAVTQCERIEDVLAHARKHPDPMLEALSYALARECGLEQPGAANEELSNSGDGVNEAPAGAGNENEDPDATSARRACAAQRARELEQTLAQHQARAEARSRRRDGTTPAAVERAVQSVLNDNSVPGPPQAQSPDPAQAGGSRMGRLIKGLTGTGRAKKDVPVIPAEVSAEPKKKIMYRGRVIEI